jgi:predicted dehydrogenase
MIRVGIIGLGFMGKMHFGCYRKSADVKIAAICDIDENKFKDTSGTAGNIAGADKPLDFTGIELYFDFDEMLKKAKLDAISITLPTYLHKAYTIKALQAGLHVLCEKPMALNEEDCDQMIAAWKASGKILQIGHCIRFWPEYVKAKEIIESGQYGPVKAATFQRLSLTPVWSWDNWLMDGKKSGGAALDLHIHDTDFVQFLFGMPQAISCQAVKGPSGDYDHVVTQYILGKDCVVTAEGGWMMSPSFGFEMSFNIVLDQAVITYDCTRTPAFKVCPAQGDAFTPEVEAGDGYSREIDHFIQAVKGEAVPAITTPDQSRLSVKLVNLEKESANIGSKVSRG